MFLYRLFSNKHKKEEQEHVTMAVTSSSPPLAPLSGLFNNDEFAPFNINKFPSAIIPPRTSSNPLTSAVPGQPIPLAIPSNWISPAAGLVSTQQAQNRKRKASVAQISLSSMLPTSFSPYTMAPQPPQPPPNPDRFATEDFFSPSRRTWSEEKEKVLTGPYDYLNGHPGKDIRSQMVKAFNAWLDVPSESLEVITKVISMLHTASLLVDDVEDNSVLRRGFPVAHSIFGIPQTINTSNYVYFHALQELQKLKNPKAVSIFSEELLNLHRGQGMDLFWRDTLTCPTEDDYLEMVSNKTGGLFRLGIKLMQAESRSPVDCVPLVNIIGLIFQIADDYHNLWNREYTANKGMCEDLTEGKFSFPVIHSIRSNPSNMQLLNILKQKTDDEQVKRYAVAYMETTGSFEYTRKVIKVLVERARKMTEEIDDGRGKSGGIHKILDRIMLHQEENVQQQENGKTE
ncbi:hypothetical protein SMACR_06570 [Sordaria macrospora]|uniref:Uncharacterized protein n=2 Tax=Sordaria macrospora TaxID=5147 RepID=A0A8S8ZS39_SORMA|nr:putative farnesyltranstransferase [Sordaria macrospora k-hell]KAA8633687.1 hypothetical protein SMACR_06570 [Sordaria macrospora]KAH7633455.1 putative farnesyltranstransferase [Sordaria sp. MPI-SDFR-AT-0083]WPJ60143.1 hypothetical protein SMAC4_06570 [Sordaria macrospora]CCC12492.1 putative farnesyltranstransferase [Sordaria macrospora k-hell]